MSIGRIEVPATAIPQPDPASDWEARRHRQVVQAVWAIQRIMNDSNPLPHSEYAAPSNYVVDWVGRRIIIKLVNTETQEVLCEWSADQLLELARRARKRPGPAI